MCLFDHLQKVCLSNTLIFICNCFYKWVPWLTCKKALLSHTANLQPLSSEEVQRKHLLLKTQYQALRILICIAAPNEEQVKANQPRVSQSAWKRQKMQADDLTVIVLIAQSLRKRRGPCCSQERLMVEDTSLLASPLCMCGWEWSFFNFFMPQNQHLW